jgi:hypothetical protein
MTVTAERPTSQSSAQRAALRAIRAYQAARSGRPTGCRYVPSCSAYGEEAIERHGAWRGGRLALRRLLRCHPLGGHGVDLVPLELHPKEGSR